MSSAGWWSKEARGGTEAEVVALALLIVRGCDVDEAADRAVRSWCDCVIADSPGYIDGEPWTSPRSWRGERQALINQFKACIKPPSPGISIEVKCGVVCALAKQFETIFVAPPKRCRDPLRSRNCTWVFVRTLGRKGGRDKGNTTP